MTTFVLIHGAGDGAWYWHLLVAELRSRDHDAIAMDLPSDDESAGLSEYADAVVDAIGDHTDLVVVGQSFGAFTAPLVCERVPAKLLVLVAGMIPSPGEPPQDWWANTGYAGAKGEQTEDDTATADKEDDVIATYYHDVPPELAAEALRRERPQTGTPMREPWPLETWPDVPTRILLCRDDRLFPAEFLRRVARERLGITADEIAGGHCVALSRPDDLADRLDAYLDEL